MAYKRWGELGFAASQFRIDGRHLWTVEPNIKAGTMASVRYSLSDGGPARDSSTPIGSESGSAFLEELQRFTDWREAHDFRLARARWSEVAARAPIWRDSVTGEAITGIQDLWSITVVP